KYQSIHSQSAFSLFLIANKNSDDKSADEEAASIAEELVDTLIDKAVNQNMALYPVPEFNRKLVKETVNHSGDMSVLFCLEGGILMDEPIQNPLINFKTSDLSTDLLNTLKSQLPHYMVPAGIVFLPSLPLTVNGKVDSKALSKIDHMPEELANEIVAPRNEIERKVFDIWKKILRIDNFSIHDNLFELGGSSITATKIVSQAGRKLGASIPLQEFIARPSVAGMSECMAALNQRESFAAAW
ncbi:MAG: phosphopantetheine-binding protein, partial [Exilibacterium sp.]